jgi:hypothetical protein
MWTPSILVALLAVAACKKEPTPSKPVTCAVAGQMVTKRMGEFAAQAKFPADKQAAVDQAMTAAITKQCTDDKWDEVTLGCLGSIAALPEGELDTATFNNGVTMCTNAIGDAKLKNMSDAAVTAARSVIRPAAPPPLAAAAPAGEAPKVEAPLTPVQVVAEPRTEKKPAPRVKRATRNASPIINDGI